MVNDGLMQIGEVASRVGLSLRTLRHWDEVGLVTPSARSAGGFRLYTDGDVQRLELVKSLKPLDFALEQMCELVALIDTLRASSGGDTDPDDDVLGRLGLFRSAADSRIEVLRVQLQGLEALSRELRRLAAAARQRTRSTD